MSEEAVSVEAVAPEAVVESVVDTGVETEVAIEAPVVPEVDLSKELATRKKFDRELRQVRNESKQAIERAKMEWTSMLRKDPMGTLQEHGISGDSLASALLGTEEIQPEVHKLDPETQKRLDELEGYKKQQVLNEFKTEVFDVVESAPEEYELILNSKGGKDLYYSAIVEYYQSYGEAPDYKEIAERIEDALLDEGKRMLSLKKLAPKVPVEAPKAEVESITDLANEAISLSESRTISNRMTPSAFNRKVTKSTDRTSRPAQSDYNRLMEEQKREIIKKFTS